MLPQIVFFCLLLSTCSARCLIKFLLAFALLLFEVRKIFKKCFLGVNSFSLPPLFCLSYTKDLDALWLLVFLLLICYLLFLHYCCCFISFAWQPLLFRFVTLYSSEANQVVILRVSRDYMNLKTLWNCYMIK